MGPTTDRSTAAAKLEELSIIAHTAAQQLGTVDPIAFLKDLLGGPDFDAKVAAITKLGDVPSYRVLVDSKLAEVAQLVAQGVLPNDITPAHKANLQAAADALGLVAQTLRNFGQAARDARSDLP